MRKIQVTVTCDGRECVANNPQAIIADATGADMTLSELRRVTALLLPGGGWESDGERVFCPWCGKP
jgi:hypothetical protein